MYTHTKENMLVYMIQQVMVTWTNHLKCWEEICIAASIRHNIERSNGGLCSADWPTIHTPWFHTPNIWLVPTSTGQQKFHSRPPHLQSTFYTLSTFHNLYEEQKKLTPPVQVQWWSLVGSSHNDYRSIICVCFLAAAVVHHCSCWK
jgi:hypothetical protein